MHLSANYFGDLVKKETGRTAVDHIKEKLFIAAKEKMNDRQKTISQIASELGFAYPQHFTRFFKRQCGILPRAFKKRN
ncbi:AraC family transcriptional regulator [Mucilaginibacter sp. SG564]|uniref:helix-turn-helix domain-containing protein n=1 Tax=Mucilaginibacter sp. SG564 TaxID=2587022 RepID=UPI00210FDFE7|nr:helix-turn-helix domain-containing protein [Mucilaginibacter sp. SG564]